MRSFIIACSIVTFLLILALAAPTPPLAQESAGYRLNEHAFNAGGHPGEGLTLSSAGFHVSLDALGDVVAPGGLSSGSFHLEGGWVVAYPPPGEVMNLHFATDGTTLIWDPEKSVGSYAVYRGALADLKAGIYGTCLKSGLTVNAGSDLANPTQVFFYLVTARNRLNEEGTKGYASSGVERPNPLPCP
jgi:hypothetical protein